MKRLALWLVVLLSLASAGVSHADTLIARNSLWRYFALRRCAVAGGLRCARLW
ncbi:MAG: hypothetical protein K8R56_02730 [Candidatus Eisenbacteria bacterium]|nr:hypothetical protein [Candidatus Eisenbacteria bacterium]